MEIEGAKAPVNFEAYRLPVLKHRANDFSQTPFARRAGFRRLWQHLRKSVDIALLRFKLIESGRK